MKKIIITTIVFVSIFSLTVFSSENDLRSIINYAFDNNLDLQKLELDIRKYQNNVQIQKGDEKPTINLSNGYSYSGKTHSDSFSTRLGLSYRVFDAGKISNNIKMSYIDLMNIKLNMEQEKVSLAYRIKQLYYSIIQKKSQIKLSEEVLKRRQKDLVLIKLKYHAGKESLQAVNESAANVAEAEYRKISAQKELQNNIFELNLILNRDVDHVIIPEINEIILKEYSFKELLEKAFENRPDILISENNVEYNRLSQKNTEADYKPKISADYSNSFSGSKLFDNNSWSAGLSWSLSLYDGNKKKYRLNNALTVIEKSELDLKDTMNNIKIEVFNNLKNYELSIKKMNIDANTLKSKKDIYTLTKLQYEQGTETYFVLQQKESDLTNAEYNYLSSELNVRTAKANLIKSLGGIWNEEI